MTARRIPSYGSRFISLSTAQPAEPCLIGSCYFGSVSPLYHLMKRKLTVLADQVILAVVFGSLLGVGFRYLMRFCERKDLIDRQSYVAQYVALALLTIGSCTLLGTDDLLAAFSCGAAFAWDGFFNKQTEEAVFSSVIDLLFNIAAFVFVGAWTPFNTFSDVNLSLSVWRLIVIGILVIILRRLPVMIALYKWIPDVKNFREAIFSGHFGPMGIGASPHLPALAQANSYRQALFISRRLLPSSSRSLPTHRSRSTSCLPRRSSRSSPSWCSARSSYTDCPSRSSRSDGASTPCRARGHGTTPMGAARPTRCPSGRI